jgi:hypothetical protein
VLVWLNRALTGLVEPQDAPRRVDVEPGVLFLHVLEAASGDAVILCTKK